MVDQGEKHTIIDGVEMASSPVNLASAEFDEGTYGHVLVEGLEGRHRFLVLGERLSAYTHYSAFYHKGERRKIVPLFFEGDCESLADVGIERLDDLLKQSPEALRQLPGLGSELVARVERRLELLMQQVKIGPEGFLVEAISEKEAEVIPAELDKLRVEAVRGILEERLWPRKRLVLDMRFGFVSGIPMSLGSVGKRLKNLMTGEFGVSKENVRRLERTALKRVRNPIDPWLPLPKGSFARQTYGFWLRGQISSLFPSLGGLTVRDLSLSAETLDVMHSALQDTDLSLNTSLTLFLQEMGVEQLSGSMPEYVSEDRKIEVIDEVRKALEQDFEVVAEGRQIGA